MDKVEFLIDKKKKRKLKKGETEYPKYKLTTIQELFDVLTPENVKRFVKDFSTCVQATVHIREATHIQAKELAKRDGKDLDYLKASDMIKIPYYTWIDD